MLDADPKRSYASFDPDVEDELEVIVAFQEGRAAQITELRWQDPDGSDEPSRVDGVDVEVGLDGPLGPWESLGRWEFDRAPDGTVAPYDLSTLEWARFVRLSAPLPAEGRRIEYPAQIEVIERATDDEYRSILGEWGYTSNRGPYEWSVARVTDEYDCATLALERDLAVQPPASLVARWRARQQLAHLADRESRLGKTCRLVTTIAEPDAIRLRQLNPPGTRIEVVPNGVDADLLELPRPEADGPAAVSFWGNLGFPVNQRAVHHFYSQIWRPHLQPRGVRWAIVGPNADTTIADLAARHEEIEVPGFVDDLFAFLRRYPIMVNPMISGAGLKNKVLEAFAAGLAVVSTSMGVEALPVRDGVQCRIADDPAAFGEAVRDLIAQPARRRELTANAEALVRSDYSWPAVSGRFARILL